MNKPQALTSVGPMRNMVADTKKVVTELIDINQDLTEFNKFLYEYYRQLGEAWTEAQKKVNMKIPDIPQDAEQFEAYKRVWIDIFDNDFTELFDSKEFAKNYGNLVSKELDLTKRWNRLGDIILQSANLPSRKEIDEIYKEVHSLRKRISKIESELSKAKKGVKNGT